MNGSERIDQPKLLLLRDTYWLSGTVVDRQTSKHDANHMCNCREDEYHPPTKNLADSAVEERCCRVW